MYKEISPDLILGMKELCKLALQLALTLNQTLITLKTETSL